jgi:hypothetical protein
MNKNKLIFAIIWIILFILIMFFVLNLKNSSSPENKKTSSWVFKIWMLNDNIEWSTSFVENFKKVNPNYSSQNIVIESFSSYEDYYYALSSAIISDKAPDLFVLNNNEKESIFSNQIVWIDPNIISPNDFRKKFKWVFSDDLIINSDENIEFLAWIPVWYESLWIFYNRRYVKNSELSSFSWLSNIVAKLKKKKPNLIPIWIWNWSTVLDSADIITQFFMLEDWIDWLDKISWNTLKQSLSNYFIFWDVDWNNWFDSRFSELTNLWEKSIDLFSKWETFMVVGYPRMINEISKKWFSKSFLLASSFPHYFSWNWKTLVNYDYFVINKDSNNQVLANDFLKYLSSDIWAEDYLDNFPYFLPALLSLESDKLEEKIHPNYNITLNDFFSDDYELWSFDKWIKNIYDKNIISILDNASNYEKSFSDFKSNILCKSRKINTLENLSDSCEK